MISDVLFELNDNLATAESEISGYLESDATKHCYNDRDFLARITKVLAMIRETRQAALKVQRELDSPI